MTNERIDEPAPAEVFDNALRWKIPSDSDPHADYVVELNAPPGYSICACTDFQCRRQPLLARGITPEDAVQQGLVKLTAGRRVQDALKCRHIIEAEKRFAEAAIASLSAARRKQERQ